MRRAVFRLFQLPRSERKLVLQAIPLLARSIVNLKLYGFKRCYQRSRINTAPNPLPVPEHRLDAAALAVRRASNGMAIGTCLSRSLALRALLHKYGIDTDFRIGVDKAGDEFEAHAWLEHDGQPIGERVPDRLKAFDKLGPL